jgi:hypothetical protein
MEPSVAHRMILSLGVQSRKSAMPHVNSSRLMLLGIVLASVLVPVSGRADNEPTFAQQTNYYDRAAVQQALQAWHRGQGPLPDLIAVQDGQNQVIAPPLTEEELQTVREALWKREANNIDFVMTHANAGGEGWKRELHKPFEPTVFQQMAWTHLLNGGALRAGDFTVLHGALLSALQPNTYALAKKWQGYMRCIGGAAKKDPSCVGY